MDLKKQHINLVLLLHLKIMVDIGWVNSDSLSQKLVKF